MRISDWSSDVCSSDLIRHVAERNDVAEADAAVRRPVQHGGDHRAGLADERDVAGLRLEVGEAGIEVDAGNHDADAVRADHRSEEHTSELQSLMRISYAVFCLKKKKTTPSLDKPPIK